MIITKETALFPIDVACAVIREGGKILITRRREGEHLGGLWEFPGGKRIAGESLVTCLRREIWEELGIRIDVVRFLRRIDYRYPEKQVSLYFYECRRPQGSPQTRGVSAFVWVRPSELSRFSFPPADLPILTTLRSNFWTAAC